MDQSQGTWVEMGPEWIAQRWPDPANSIRSVWVNRMPSGKADGFAVLHTDGSLSLLTTHPLQADRIFEVSSLACDLHNRQSSGIRPSVNNPQLHVTGNGSRKTG